MSFNDNLDVFFDKYYNLALRYLSFRPRSEKEVKQYLKKKKAQDLLIEKIINKLKEQKFLNDEEFAKMWIENRIRSKPKAWRLIKMELRQKGISEETINRIFNFHFSPASPSEAMPRAGEAGRAIFNEKEMVEKLIDKKMRKYKGLSRSEIYQKLGRFLAQKGFDWETIKHGIDEFLKKGV